jgi:hypothetical protein
VIKRFSNEGVSQFAAFFVGFDGPPKFFPLFNKKLIPVKNGTLLPDMGG